MSSSAPCLATIGEIARRLSVPPHRVEYLIRARNIPPCGWAGNARVFRDADVDHIRDELRRIDEGKSCPS